MLEAAAYGLGIIVSDTGGAKELIPDETFGIVLPRATTENTLIALQAFYEDRAYLASCGAAVQKRVVEKFNWDAVAQDLLDIVKQLKQ